MTKKIEGFHNMMLRIPDDLHTRLLEYLFVISRKSDEKISANTFITEAIRRELDRVYPESKLDVATGEVKE